MKYRKEIDGLRAVAIIPVILFHAGFNFFSGGFVGVDVFFVISGYLITSIIIEENKNGNFSFLHFYERRARRILPTLYFIMLLCIPLSWIFMLPEELKDFSESLIAVPIFLSNILFWTQSGYFDKAAEFKPLLHTWSLAVEEQFYVFFPILLLLIWKIGKKSIPWFFVAGAIISIILAEWATHHKPSAAFFLLPTRAWELLIGSLISYMIKENSAIIKVKKQTKELLSIVGLSLILFSIFAYDDSIAFPGLYALAPVLGTALLIVFSSAETWVGKVLGNRLFVGIGLISYSAYLWHQPIFVFARLYRPHDLTPALYIALSCASILLAFFSYKYVETPFRYSKKITSKAVFCSSLVFALLFLAIGLAGVKTNGFEKYYFSHRFSFEENETYQLIKKHTGGDLYTEMRDDGQCIFWNKTVDKKLENRFDRCKKKYAKAIIILGDSHAMNIFNIVAESKITPFVVGISQGGCRPLDNRDYCQYDLFDKFANQNRRSIDTVIFHQTGSYFLESYLGKLNTFETFKHDKSYKIYEKNIDKTIQYVDKLSTIVNVIWLGPFVEVYADFRDVRNFMNNGFKIDNRNIEIYDQLNDFIISRLKQQKKNSRYISFKEIVDINSDFLKTGDCITYRDDDHFSICGEVMISEFLKKKAISLKLRNNNL